MPGEPWARQKELAAEPRIPTQKELLRVAQSLEIWQEKALFLLCYLTAGRISEVLELRCESFIRTFRAGREVIQIQMPNRKNKMRHRKDIPIPLDREDERLLIEPILSHVSAHRGSLFQFSSRARAWQILRKAGCNPHWLRHVRLTHLETIYGMSPERLRIFAGWSDSRPAKHYLELNWGDLLEGM